MELEEITKQKFEEYTQKGSVFDQISWRLRPDHIAENGMMTRDELKNLCWHFYVYGVSDSSKIKERVVSEQQKSNEVGK